MPWFYYVVRPLVRMFLFLLTRCDVRGKENVPSDGALLIIANHLNLADPPLLGVSLGRRVRFMAKKELFHSRVIAYFIRQLGAFPVHRGQMDRKALRQANQLLAQGQALAMFPEGMRSRSGQLRSAFPGSVLIASRSGVPILPVGITGIPSTIYMGWLLELIELTPLKNTDAPVPGAPERFVTCKPETLPWKY